MLLTIVEINGIFEVRTPAGVVLKRCLTRAAAEAHIENPPAVVPPAT